MLQHNSDKGIIKFQAVELSHEQQKQIKGGNNSTDIIPQEQIVVEDIIEG